MASEVILHKARSLIMEGDGIFEMANSQMGDLYLLNESFSFVAAGGLVSNLNKKVQKYIASDTVKQKIISIPLNRIVGLECIVRKTILKKYATIRLHLYDGEVLYFSVGNGNLDDTAEWLDGIRVQCVKNKLKQPYLKVNGELVN